jgi:hypothetical protein
VRTVGSAALPSRPLVEYSLSVPGIHTAIIGTGQIDDDSRSCQMQQNLAAAQTGVLSASDRRDIEKLTASVKDGKTNYFQLPKQELTAPRQASIEQEVRGGQRVVRLKWQTAYAGDEPIVRYEIWRDHQKAGQVAHQPQTTMTPFAFEDAAAGQAARTYLIAAVDAAGRNVPTGDLAIAAV